MLTRRLAEFVADTRVDDIPPAVLEGARHAITDTVGCALAGTLETVAELAARWVTESGATGRATVWGRAMTTSPAEAAFANGIAGHALDFDDSLPTLRGHPSTTMAPAAVAVGEVTHASGKAVLAAFAIGLEVAGKLGRAVGAGHYMRGWHTTATIGAFSSTAAAARLWGLDAAQVQVAFGLAASQVSGLVCNFGTMTKPFHAGHAARTGVLSAWMAKHGFTANPEIFDDREGFLRTYAGDDGESLAKTLATLGRSWEMLEPGIYVKRWPACYCNHRPVGGMLQMMQQHGIRAEDVESVEIGFPPGSDTALVSDNPATGLAGKFSIEYCAAATLADGRLTLDSFTDPMVQRPEVRALMGKVRRYRIDAPGTYSGVVGFNDIAITTRHSRQTLRVEKAPGSPDWPMTDADRVEKFMTTAGRVLGEPGARRLLDLLGRSTTLADVGVIAAATVPAAGAATARPTVPANA